MTSSTDPLRIGILGAARIARSFVEAVRPSAKVMVTAVAGRDSERAAAFARELHIGRAHASYKELLADPDIDAVYVPLPNNLHAEWSIRPPMPASTSSARSRSPPVRRRHRPCSRPPR
jgi:xylose dehydrogenase (NAD/NADP)